jgi:hypothetical protein
MKPTRQNKVLGIAVGERSMLVAEVHSVGEGAQVIKAAELTYPEGSTIAKDAAAIGAALGQFLKEKGFSARNAVFGLPAKWVLSKQKEVPALEDTLLADTLRLQAESEFSTELGELVYDYAGSGAAGGSAGGTTTVLLLAVPKRYIDQIKQVAEAARIRVLAVTPFSTALASSSKASADAMTLVLGPSGVEFTSQQNGHPRVLRYVGNSTDSTPMLMGELRRASNRTGAGASGPREIFIWNDSGADESQFQTIGQSLELGVRDGQLKDLGVSAAPGVMNGRDFATSISLAIAGITPGRGTADFLDSRLAAPPEKRIDQRTVAAILAVVILIGLTGWWYLAIQKRQAEVSVIEKVNFDRTADRTAAQAVVKKIQLAQRWHGEKPKFVACLTDLTELTPQTADIYGTSFTLKDDASDAAPAANAGPPKPPAMKGQLLGKATNDSVILALAKKLTDDKKRFAGAKIASTDRRDNKGQPEISFIIEFTYLPK